MLSIVISTNIMPTVDLVLKPDERSEIASESVSIGTESTFWATVSSNRVHRNSQYAAKCFPNSANIKIQMNHENKGGEEMV